MYQIEIADKAKKKFQKLPKPWQIKIGRAINILAIDPFIGKKLHGDYKGAYSLRAWPFRIIYSIDSHHIIVEVLDLGHRKDIYRQG